MPSRRVLAALLAACQASPANAGLSFVQIVQAQTSQGKEGVFGKTWVELEGLKMRLVSGYAGKLGKGGKAAEPSRVIQLLDLDKKTRLILYPERKAFSRAPLGDLDYDGRLARGLRRGRPVMRMVLVSAKLTKRGHTRMLLGTLCEHYRLRARFHLEAPNLGRREARMDQDVWVAPLTGPLSGTVLDLIAFENAYREATGGALSPIDHERYQLREAAAYLQVPQESLHHAVEELRQRLRELPSYPVASSVSWWLPEAAEEPVRKAAPAGPPPVSDPRVKVATPLSLGEVRPAPHPPGRQSDLGTKAGSKEDPVVAFKRTLREHVAQPPAYARSGLGAGSPAPEASYFRVISWHNSEARINRMYHHTRGQFAGNFPFGPLKLSRGQLRESRVQEPTVYPKFQNSLKEILGVVAESGASAPQIPAQQPDKTRSKPFYEIYAELQGLESAAQIPAGDLSLPGDFEEVPYEVSKSTP